MTDITEYLMNVAPVVLVMGVGCAALWKRNNALIDRIHERDMANLKTLTLILSSLEQIETAGKYHFDETRKHISDRIDELKKALQ
jgi:tRNA A37 threonylcarbamoyladenosine synthetase subunit TsaC/SUA5/YrdC